LVLAAFLLAGCGAGAESEGEARGDRADSADRAESDEKYDHAEHDRADHAESDENYGHAEHDRAASEASASHDHHDHGEGSDLDRSVEELFAAHCEHGIPAHTCDECRYEVGVVAVSPELLEEGLVEVAPIAPRHFAADVELTGEIRFDESKIAHLGPRMPGVVREVRIDLGQPVRTGEPLIEIDSPELAEAEAGYLDALAQHRLAKRTLDRQKELRSAGISSEREFLQAEQTYEATLIRSNSERQKLLRFGLSEAEIADLEAAGISGATGRHLLRAPFPGEALVMHAVRGERVELDSELILFGDTHSLWVWVDLYESHLDAVTRAQAEHGLPARVAVRAYPGETFDGQVDFIGRTMDEATRTVKARVTLENPEGKLRPGMFATVRLEVGDGGDGLAVPESAVLSDEGRDFVFIRRDDRYFVRRPVEPGRRDDGWIEIVDGLEIGQSVATTGAFLLKSDVLRSKMGEGCAH
jgi:cobalt-zinc-cadmium efflux system membrane fusion protein